MNTIVIMGIAVGLAMDAFAVAIATSAALVHVNKRQLFRLSWHFGLFQALMPIIGWSVGRTVVDYVSGWDHWLVFGMLTYVGGRAIYGAYRAENDAISGKESTVPDPTKGWSLVMLSVATSIDALAVGLSFGVLNSAIWYPSLIIGVVAATFTLVGMLIGSRLGARFGERMAILGGVVLIAIGLQIVVGHTMGS